MEKKIEKLARWLHGAHVRNLWDPGLRQSWNQLSDASKRRYLVVARELLEKPPPVLVKHLTGACPHAGTGLAGSPG